MSGHAAVPGLRPETRQAIDAVSRALALAAERVGARDVTVKSGRDLVTATDVAVENTVRDLLADARGLPVVGEERGGDATADGSAYWVLDPICGTRNFASGTPLYCVNLALVEGGQVTASAVGDPSTGEILVAERGRGAWALADGAHRRLAASAESRTDGRPWTLRSDSIVASATGALHGELLQLARSTAPASA